MFATQQLLINIFIGAVLTDIRTVFSFLPHFDNIFSFLFSLPCKESDGDHRASTRIQEKSSLSFKFFL